MKQISILLVTLILAACARHEVYRIGVSQCSEDDWRALLNTEIQREARFMGDMDVEVASAGDDSRRQIADIDRYVEEGKDLIIVAPNVAADIQPAIERAMNAGIPVILIDRRISGDKYTAFIGADNYAIGKAVGQYLRAHSDGRPVTIVELRGLRGSTPEQERHDGFMSQYADAPSQVVCSPYADWNEADATRVMDSLLLIYNNIDYVFAHNDRMALGACKAVRAAGREGEIRVVGIDGLTTPGGGVDMILEGSLLATHTYPTGGSEAIQLAHRILTGEPFERELTLPSALVDSANARVMHLQYLSMKTQDDKYQRLEAVTDRQLAQINTQRWMLGGSIAIVLLTALLTMTYYRLYREKAEAGEMLMAQIKTLVERQQFIHEAQAEVESADDDGDSDTPPAAPAAPEDPLLAEIGRIIESRMGDSELSVNDIASELHLSRVQLYRRIKAISEVGLGDIIRRTRMERARQLLATGRHNVSEVAYQVGFSSPSYFTKCYKEYWGESPSARRSV